MSDIFIKYANDEQLDYADPTSKGSANDELMRKAMHSLTEKMKAIGCTGAEVSALAGVKIGKTSTKDMSVGEISTLANNLESWIQE